MAQVHGFPKVMGVLTHLDKFDKPSILKKTKKKLKVRLCSLNVHWMFTGCSLDVHWLFTGCSLDVHLMFTECSLSVH
jgi:hypothetical protein